MKMIVMLLVGVITFIGLSEEEFNRSSNSAIRPADPDAPLITGVNHEIGELLSSKLGEEPFSSCANLKSIDVVRDGKDESVPYDVFEKKKCKRDKNLTYENEAAIGGYTWSYRIANGEATIGAARFKIGRGAGTRCAVSPDPTGSINIPASLGGVRVTCIERNAFTGCTNLTSVSIPASVTRIEPGAFSDCSSLMSFSVAAGNPSYSARNGLLCSKDGKNLVAGVNGDVKIPLGVKNIGWVAFKGRDGLKSVEIPAGVTNVDIAAFVDCGGLKSFAVDVENSSYSARNGMLFSKDGLTLISGVNGEVVIPPDVKSISRGAFIGRDGVTEVTFSKGVTCIGYSAFFKCNKLKSVTIPSTVTNVEVCLMGSPFSECGELTSFSVDAANPAYSSRNGMLCSKDGTTLLVGVNGDGMIPEGVTIIERGAFCGRRGLASVTIPSSVRSIGDRAFLGCRELASVKIPSSVTSIGSNAFDGSAFYKNLPDGLVILGGGVLHRYKGECPSRLTIPEGVTSIGGSAFLYSGRGLKHLTIPSSVMSIGASAFGFCFELSHLTIPSTVTNIGKNAFCGGRFRGLKSVDVVKDGNIETVSFEEFSRLWEIKNPSTPFSLRIRGSEPTVTRSKGARD